jgi:carboxyl-terminal processing protease
MLRDKTVIKVLFILFFLSFSLLQPDFCSAETNKGDLQATKKIYYRVLSITQNSYYSPISSWLLYEGTLKGLHDYFGEESFTLDYSGRNKLLISFANGKKLSIRKSRVENNALYMVDSLSDIFDQLLVTVPDDKKLEAIYAAIDGMVSVLDPHSSYIRPDDFKKMRMQNKGKFSGIGVEITIRKNILTIVSPFEGTPAFRAGLKAHDRIVKIEDEPTEGMSLIDAAQKMRGPQGTILHISVLRKGWTTPKVFTLKRETIPLNTIKPRMLTNNIAYVRISRFLENSTKDLLKALLDLEMRFNFKGLVLDLRNNPGGLLNQAVNIADMFLQEGMIVFTKGRIQDRNMRFQAHVGKKKYTFPVIVLVNEGSASGTEILAAALRDNNRALVIGTRTFGKGSIQTIFPLRSGGAIRLTTAKFFTPNGTEIQEHGITPDFITKIANEEERAFKREEDLESAIEGNPQPIPANVPTVLLEMQGEDDDPILNLATEIMQRHLQDQKNGFKKIFEEIMAENLPAEQPVPSPQPSLKEDAQPPAN